MMSFITKSALSETYPKNTPAVYSSSEDHSASLQKQVPLLPPPMANKGEWFYHELARHPVIYNESFVPQCSFTIENSLNQIPPGLKRIERPFGVRGNQFTGNMPFYNPYLINNKYVGGIKSSIPYIASDSLNVQSMWNMTCPVKSSSDTVPLLDTQSSKPKLDPVTVPSDILENKSLFQEMKNLTEEHKTDEKPIKNKKLSSINDTTLSGNKLVIDEDHSNSELDSGIHSMQVENVRSLLSFPEEYEENLSQKQILKYFPSPKYKDAKDKFNKNDMDIYREISVQKTFSPVVLKSPSDQTREEDSVDKSKFETPSILRARCNSGRIFSDVVNDCSVIQHTNESDDEESSRMKNDGSVEFHKFAVPSLNFVMCTENDGAQSVDNDDNNSYDDGGNCVNDESVCNPVRSSTPFDGFPQLLENIEEDSKKDDCPNPHDSSESVFENEEDASNACKDDLRERGLEESEIILTCEENTSDDFDNNEDESNISSYVEDKELVSNVNGIDNNKFKNTNTIFTSKSTNSIKYSCSNNKSRVMKTRETVSTHFDHVHNCDKRQENESETKDFITNETLENIGETDKKLSINVDGLVASNEKLKVNEITNNQLTSFSPWQPWANVGNGSKSELLKTNPPDSDAFMNINTNTGILPSSNISENCVNNGRDENVTFYSQVYYHMNNISTEKKHVLGVNVDKNELPVLSNSILAGIVPDSDLKIEHNQKITQEMRSYLCEDNIPSFVYNNHRKSLPSLEGVKGEQLYDKQCQKSAASGNEVLQGSGSVASLPPLAMFKRSTPSELQMWTSLSKDQQKKLLCQQNSTSKEYSKCVFSAPILTKTLTETSIQSKITIEKIYQDQNINELAIKKNISDCSVLNERRSPDVCQNIESPQDHYMKKNTKSLNPLAVYYMSEWFDKHQKYPYPTTAEKKFFAKAGSISLAQVSSWFANKRARMCVRGRKLSPMLNHPKSASPNLQNVSKATNCDPAKGYLSPVFAMPNSYKALSGKENDTHKRENLMKESLLKKTSINKHKRGLSDVSNINGGWNSSPEVEYNTSKKQRITSE